MFSRCPGAAVFTRKLPVSILLVRGEVYLSREKRDLSVKVQLPVHFILLRNRYYKGFGSYLFNSNVTTKPQWRFFRIRCIARWSKQLCISFCVTAFKDTLKKWNDATVCLPIILRACLFSRRNWLLSERAKSCKQPVCILDQFYFE